MKSISKAFCLMLIAIPTLAAAEGIKNCGDVNIGDDVLAKFPNAAKACHDVTLKGDGIYMHFVAQVVATDKDTVTVDMLDTNDKGITRVKFIPAAGQTVKLDGKDMKYTELKKGTKLDFYVEHKQWGLYASPEGKRMTIVSREDL